MPVEVVSCVVCGNRNFTVDADATRLLNLSPPFRVEQCQECDFRWLAPRPTEQEYMELYEQAYFLPQGAKSVSWFADYPAPPENSLDSEMFAHRVAAFEARLRRLRKRFPQGGEPLRILDVGAAGGDFLAKARETGWAISGIEPSEAACARALKNYGIRLTRGGVADLLALNEKFHVIHLNHVFEHILDPVGFLTDAKQCLLPGGVLILEVPNQFDSVTRRAREWANSIKQYRRDIFSIHHPFFYSPRTLSRLLARCDWEIQESRSSFWERRIRSVRGTAVSLIDMLADWLKRAGEDVEVLAVPGRTRV